MPPAAASAPGQSWADALGKDEAVDAGDIVVTEDRAKQMSQPPAQKGQQGPPARGGARRRRRPHRRRRRPQSRLPRAAETDPAKRSIRSVGPTFIPAR